MKKWIDKVMCSKIKEMQEEGKKGKIAYITYSFNTQFTEGEQGLCSTGIWDRVVFGRRGRVQKLKYKL